MPRAVMCDTGVLLLITISETVQDNDIVTTGRVLAIEQRHCQ